MQHTGDIVVFVRQLYLPWRLSRRRCKFSEQRHDLLIEFGGSMSRRIFHIFLSETREEEMCIIILISPIGGIQWRFCDVVDVNRDGIN